MTWINGKPQATLAANDRAVQFGDGSFSTARIKAGKVQLLTAHLQRLRLGCERLLIEGCDWAALEQEMCTLAATTQDAVLKVIISRGAGGRGYSPAGCQQPTRILTLSALPAHYLPLQHQGARLVTSPVQLARNPLLAGIKHLNRLEQVLIRARLEQTGADEALVLDTQGVVVECCAANLFWREGERVFTPSIAHAGVDGVMRQHLLSVMAEMSLDCQIVEVMPERLKAADEVWICNALMPILPVRQIDDTHYASRQFYHLLAACCYQDLL